MGDVALSGFLLGRGALSREVAERPQLKQVWMEVVPVVGGASTHGTGGGGGRVLDATY
jgi:hypothetical protein